MQKDEWLLGNEQQPSPSHNTPHIPSEQLLLDIPPNTHHRHKIDLTFHPPQLPSNHHHIDNHIPQLLFTDDISQDAQSDPNSPATDSMKNFPSTPNKPTLGHHYDSVISKLQLALSKITQASNTESCSQPVEQEEKVSLKLKQIQPTSPTLKSLTSRIHRKVSFDGIASTSTSFKLALPSNKNQSHSTERQNLSFRELENVKKVKEKYKTEFVIEEELSGKEQQAQRQRFIASLTEWQEKRERRVKQEKERKEKEEGTFKPTINLKSREIMRKKGKMAPIYERQTQKQKVMSMTQSTKLKDPVTPKHHH